MATTFSDIADLVLQNIGVKAAGQSASAEDSDLVEDWVNAIFVQLNIEGVIIEDWEDIANRVWPDLVDICSLRVAGFFGIQGERLQNLIRAEKEARINLAKWNQGKKHPVPVHAYYY